MPNSRPPRKPYRGSRSGRDLSSGKLDITSSAPTGPAATEHRPASAGSQPGVTGGGHEPGPSNGPTPHRQVPAGPGHLRSSNRRGILITAGAAGLAAGGGGLVYDRKRRRAGVSKVYNPYTGEIVEFGKSSGGRIRKAAGKKFVLPVGSSTSVRPLLPRGPHVSHENDLSVTTRRGQRKGSPSALARYSSGSETQMTGGGQAYGHKASHVKKSLSTQQYAAARGTRGTPLSGIAQAGRVGHRLAVR